MIIDGSKKTILQVYELCVSVYSYLHMSSFFFLLILMIRFYVQLSVQIKSISFVLFGYSIQYIDVVSKRVQIVSVSIEMLTLK